MKAKLIFNLPEDNEAYELANCATDMSIILFDLQQRLRHELKHNGDDLSSDVYQYIEKMYEELNAELSTLPCSSQF